MINNYKCVVCGKEMYIKPSRIKRTKNGVTCSKECGRIRKSALYSGEGNPQYGIRGKANASFKNEKIKNRFGYITVYNPEHPFCNKLHRVLEHRLVVEQNADLFEPKYFLNIGDKKYLRPEIEVHHKNEIKDDNRIENLIPLTKGEHISLHNKTKEIIRDKKNGRIITFVKNDSNKKGAINEY